MKLTLHESRDWEMAWKISQHPAVVEGVTNDAWGSQALAVRRFHVKLLVENPANRLLLVKDEDTHGLTVGAFLLDNTAPGVMEVHTMLLPVCRGVHAIAIGRQAAKFILALPGIEKLVSQCPMNKREILFYALKCGFHKAGEAAMSWIKAGQIYPLQWVELNRKDLLCR